jgi:dTDP-4-amino-4,6-dideoxygalactose transaminase
VIPISTVELGPEVEALVLEVLRSGQVAQGPLVARFEEAFAARCGVDHAVAVSNGTVSLMAALQALDIGPGDEVLTTPFTFVATLNAILHVGATVRFGDIDEGDFLLDPQSVAGMDPPAAVVPVHLYGQPADVPAIVSALGGEVAVVEDAAQAHGARLGDRTVGSFGVGSFSFYATKNIATGEGGMVTTDDAEVAETVRLLRNQGMRARYQYELPGHNFRMTDLQAALGVPQLERLDAIIEARQANARLLSEGLGDLDGLVTPFAHPDRTHVWHQYTVRITPDAKLGRDEFVAAMHAGGVGAGVYYPRLVHDYDCYRDHPRIAADPTPIAARVAGEVVSLPVHPGLSGAQVEQIIDVARGALT